MLVHKSGQASLTRAPAWSEERARGSRRAEVVAQASLSCRCAAIHLLAPYGKYCVTTRRGCRPGGPPDAYPTGKRRFFMSFSDHKITQFTHKITDLPDQPNLPADELKARFDSSPEELRQSVNGICDDADRLDARVSGIITETFGDTIDKEMLSDELAAELDGKAEAADLTALDTRVAAAETALPQKVECYFGTYTGNGSATREITLEFTPSILITCTSNGILGTTSGYEYSYGGICTPDHPVRASSGSTPAVKIIENGFQVAQDDNAKLRANKSGQQYYYIAFT